MKYVSKNKRIQTDNCVEKVVENIKEKHISNAYKEVGSLKGSFKPHTNLRTGTNDGIISNEEVYRRGGKPTFKI